MRCSNLAVSIKITRYIICARNSPSSLRRNNDLKHSDASLRTRNFKKFSATVERDDGARIIILTTFPDEHRPSNQPLNWKKEKPVAANTLVVKLPKFKKMKNNIDSEKQP